MVRWLTAGESHGPALVATVEGLPAGIRVSSADIGAELARRRLGHGRGARMKFEQDEIELLGGLRHGVSLGGPVSVVVRNTEWPKWERVMAPDPIDPAELEGLGRNAPLTRPRPGHADLAGMQKYGFDDARPVLERASARETAARVALGTVARALLRQAYGIEVVSHVVAIGAVEVPPGTPPPTSLAVVDADPVRCADPASSALMVAEIDAAHRDADTLGGIVEVLAYGCPPGLGSYVHGDRRLDARLAGELMGIQAIKGVEFGDGFRTARRRGSVAHDEIEPLEGPGRRVRRASDRAGGVEGGMTTGEPLRVRAAMKPISSLSKPLATIDVATGDPAVAIAQRSDVCAVPAAGVVAEAMVALVLAGAALEKFGGDSVEETRRNYEGYLKSLAVR
ncbi:MULTISPECIES: chorismate synthase [Parafrankia]|uniref:Chorismate synthase n=1 Tax=Parafrankia soli TaxID=2599596 RepID=A0A1S1Q5D6_9ACTN|nr:MULTISPECIES: chorismate synthase [Parafrankia]OHV27394.1 chorismate synthase [Parafrankia soli]TCJ34817.1 chorismate synthase [Parafrankia sp. BMG5.11]CAI7977653.1 chorismate synthase [Frankia sp. Hr75.2]SQD97866.1 chorismate synthase [Parafrankia sp. Ea1.12]